MKPNYYHPPATDSVLPRPDYERLVGPDFDISFVGAKSWKDLHGVVSRLNELHSENEQLRKTILAFEDDEPEPVALADKPPFGYDKFYNQWRQDHPLEHLDPYHAWVAARQSLKGTQSNGHFDTWQENPYTKTLQKSIEDDYVPKFGIPGIASRCREIRRGLEMGLQAAYECKLNATAHISEMKQALNVLSKLEFDLTNSGQLQKP